MAQTAQAISPRNGKLELVVSAAIVSALSNITAESIDISSIVKNISGGEISREVEKEFVIGDSTPITTYDTRIDYGDFTITFLYTNDKETLGTDNLDIYTFLKDVMEHTAADLSLQFIWSPAGGAVGDEELLSSATQSFIKNLTAPVGGEDTTGKLQCSVTIGANTWTKATVA